MPSGQRPQGATVTDGLVTFLHAQILHAEASRRQGDPYISLQGHGIWLTILSHPHLPPRPTWSLLLTFLGQATLLCRVGATPSGP